MGEAVPRRPESRADRPALADGEAAADVPQADREIHDTVDVLDRGTTTRSAHPLALDEHDLLGRILEPGRGEDRSALLLQSCFGDPCRPVAGPDSGEGGEGQHQRGPRGHE